MDEVASSHAQSDYGSDFDDEAQLDGLLDSFQVGGEPVILQDLEGNETTPAARIPLIHTSQSPQTHIPRKSYRVANTDNAIVEVQLDSYAADQVPIARDESPGQTQVEPVSTAETDANDPRSPLERFRMKPKKPLSVTDLVSPAWCELQYWYNLTKYGRVKRTNAMQRGSELHKVLEEQVHLTVPIEVQTREDTWGLRIWNVVQGLRSLRATGLTRELELWGIVHGEVVNGVIDELSFTCTDPDLEDYLFTQEHNQSLSPSPSGQTTIAQFFGSRGDKTLETLSQPSRKYKGPEDRMVYLIDVKTRASKVLPNTIAMRPTHMQLMLYRKLLSDMATNSVHADLVFDRYGLQPDASFSDQFIVQLGSLDFTPGSQVDEGPGALATDPDTVTELLSHNSLRQLWLLMIEEFGKTLPNGARSISNVLKTEFRSSKDSTIVGVKTFPYLDHVIEGYIREEMAWWKGDRAAKGVNVEEAFKCRICEFAEDCSWRIGKVNDAVEASKARQRAKTLNNADE